MDSKRSPIETYRKLAAVATWVFFGSMVSFAVFPAPVAAAIWVAVALLQVAVLWHAMLFIACPRCREPIGSAIVVWGFTPAAWAAHRPPKDLKCSRCGAPLGTQGEP